MKALRLPLAHWREALISCAFVLALYGFTGAHDLTFYDSPELALVATQLGLGHPIGEPLHTLIGFVFTQVMPPLLGLSIMSALFGALAILPAFSIAEQLGAIRTRTEAIVAGAILFVGAAQRCAWEPATRIEVYTLAIFLALMAFAYAIAAQDRARSYWPVGLMLGLCACTHAVIAAAHLIALAPILCVAAWRRPKREIAIFAVALIVGALPYLYVPFAGGRPEVFTWGDPQDLGSLTRYLRGSDYAHNQGITLAALGDHAIELAMSWAPQGTLPVLLLGSGCSIGMGRGPQRVAMPIALALLLLFVCSNVVFHPDVPDYLGYLAAPLFAGASAIAAAMVSLMRRGKRFGIYAVVAGVLMLVPAVLSIEVRDRDVLGRTMVEGAMRELPRDAIVVVEADHWVGTMLYAQEVEGLRPDVIIVARGLASSRWYWEHLFARHDDLSPIELRAPGGRDARITRLIDANIHRPVVVESITIANDIGRTPCAVGWLVWTDCPERPDPNLATAAIAGAAPYGREPIEVAGRIDLARGEALWRMGHPREAVGAMAAGLDHRFALPALPALDGAPPLTGPLPAWQRHAALHDPARNIAMTGLLLFAGGQRGAAREYLAIAESDGLPEATTFLDRYRLR